MALVASLAFEEHRTHYVDVGANIGDTALIIEAASRFELRGDLVEPSPLFFKFLRRNSRVLNCPTLHNKFAASEVPPRDLIGQFMHWTGSAEIIKGVSKNVISNGSDQLQLGDLINSQTALVKIDCEGQDVKILLTAGLAICSGTGQPWLAFELIMEDHNDLADFDDLLEVLQKKYSEAATVDSLNRVRIFRTLEELRDYIVGEWHSLEISRRRHFQHDLILVPNSASLETKKTFRQYRKFPEQNTSSHFTYAASERKSS